MRCVPQRSRRLRAAFTLIELLVVLGIIAILVSLLAAAVFRTLASQQAAATDSTLEKVDGELTKQWKEVLKTANTEAVPATVIALLAGGDERRARVIWVKIRLIQEFPTTYAEAHNPVPGYLAGKPAFKNLPVPPYPATHDPTTESSACLLIALKAGRGGINWSPESTLGAGAVKDTDGDQVPEIVDTWGKAIYFVRLPIPNKNPNLPGQAWVQDLNPNGMQTGTNDNQDPDGTLLNPQWAQSIPGAAFGGLCHPVQSNRSWPNLTPFVGSAGSNHIIGDNDDRYSYRLRHAGSGGQR